MKRVEKQTGFTIVELLIVVVVIAILAAITIVAYNGIQNRAKASAAQQGLSQANKKILSYAIDTADTYPLAAGTNGIDNLASLGINNSGAVTYQYSANNDITPRTFCVTGTIGSQSFYVSNTNASVKQGSCPGHNGGGVAAITNLVTNPSFEADTTTTWAFNTPGLTSGSGAASTPSGGYAGNKALRYTMATSGTMANFGPYTQIPGLSSTVPYKASVWVRSSKPININIVAERRNSASAALGSVSAAATTLTANTWQRLTLDVPTTATMARITFCIYASYGSLAAGDFIDYDAVMMTEGSGLYNFSDGSTNNWVWNGTSNDSTSTGVPVGSV